MPEPTVTILDASGTPMQRFEAAAHDAGSLSLPELASWNPFPGSADADFLPERSTIVSRSRDLTRNNGVAAGGVQTLLDNVVGTGLRLSAKPDYVALGRDLDWQYAWARKTESRFRNWANSRMCDAARSLSLNGLTAQIFRSGVMNGEGLALPLWMPERNDNGLVLQVIEPDRLSNPYDGMDTATRRGGIEYDAWGGPLAYWIRKSHPGDLLLAYIAGGEWERIPAETSFGRLRVIHVHDKERAGQSRGKPSLTSVMRQFKVLDHYTTSELQAAVVNAMLAAFIETPLEPGAAMEMVGSVDSWMQKIASYPVRLKGGSIPVLPPGTKMAPFMPARPAQAFPFFVESVLRQIAAGLNMPYELLLKDFSKTNYSSARAALLEAWRFFLGRRQWLATYWMQPVYELWLEGEVNAGRIEAPGFYENRTAWCQAKWIGPGKGWVDPVKEAQAARLRMDSLLSTLEDECAEQGKDWEEVIDQRAREQRMIRERGVEIPPAAGMGHNGGPPLDDGSDRQNSDESRSA